MRDVTTLALILLAFIVLAALVLAWQVHTPRIVRWDEVEHAGVPGWIAEGLVLQHDDGRSVWATRGYSIYRSVDGDAFRKVAKIQPPRGEAWGGYLRTLRSLYGYQELVEVMPLDEQRLLAFAGGFVHVLGLDAGSVRRTHQLRYFGRGKGRGLMAFGLVRDDAGALYFAEYVTESGDRPTGVWKSEDEGETWTLCYEFAPTDIRHIHAVQCDPVDGAMWIGTGDRDEHCFVGRSLDGGSSFTWIGHGRQIHRTCAFAFFDDVVLWGMDADFEQNHVIRWHRATGEVTIDAELPDATYYASRIDDRLALLGVAQGVAQAWVASSAGDAVRWLDWSVPLEPPKRGPSPGVRLARGDASGGRFVHVNPLRTNGHEAAIYRISRDHVPSP